VLVKFDTANLPSKPYFVMVQKRQFEGLIPTKLRLTRCYVYTNSSLVATDGYMPSLLPSFTLSKLAPYAIYPNDK
jgi:hypothetical protein